jgi:hypothetical protein
MTAVSPIAQVSPCLSEFERFLSRREASSIRAENLRKRKAPASPDSEDDNVPLASILGSDKVVSLTEVRAVVESEPVIVRRNTRRIHTLSEGKRHIDSNSDDDIPITATLTKPLKGGPKTGIPTGTDAIGLIVARDFGANGGIFHGRISAVDMEGRILTTKK